MSIADIDGGTLAEQYRVLHAGVDVVVLQRHAARGAHEAVDRPRPRLLMAGEIVSSMSVLEAVNTIAGNGWRGDLTVEGNGSHRKFRIEAGALKSAASSVPAERLGEVMVSLGLLTPEQQAQCIAADSGVKRFGHIVLELGFSTKELLFHALCQQTVRVFESALREGAGFLTFTEIDVAADAADLSVHLQIQGLLMECVQRIDEMALYRKSIPSSRLCPVLTEHAAKLELPAAYQQVSQWCDGRHDILQIAAKLGADEFYVTKALATLLRAHAIELREPSRLDEAEAEPWITALNAVLRCIRTRVDQSGSSQEMNWTLEAWMRETPLAEFFGDKLSDAGEVCLQDTVVRMGKLQLERPLRNLDRAVHELATFAMFSAGPTLSREEQQQLAGEIERQLAPLRARNAALRSTLE